MNSPKFAVIFDMDGVLIDTVRVHWQTYNKLLRKEYGVFVDDSMLASIIGMSLAEQIPILNKKFNIQINVANFIKETTIQNKSLLENLQPKPGALELIKSLHSSKIPLGLGTSSSRFIAVERMKKINLYKFFTVILGEEDVAKHKPDPEIYNKVASRLRVPNLRCVVIEDAPNGILAASSANMKSIGVVTRFVNKSKLAGADLIVNSLNDTSIDMFLTLFKEEH